MKTKLKHLLNSQVFINNTELYGKITHYMIWSPVHHQWIYPEDCTWCEYLTKKERDFLLNQEVVRIGLRNDMPNHIAIFLKDLGKDKNKKLKQRFNKEWI